MAHQERRLPSSAGRQWRKEQLWRRERWGAVQQVFQLLVEDIIEEVGVVAEEEQGKLSSWEW